MVPQASVQLPTRGPRPPLHSSTRRAHPNEQGTFYKAALMTSRSGPLPLTMGPPLVPPPGCSHHGLCLSLQDSPAMPCPCRASCRPGAQGALGPLNCTCHRVPSTQLVSCCHCVDPAMGRLIAPSPPSVSTALALWVPGPSLLRAHVNMYISQARASRGLPQPVFHALTCTIIFSKVLG